MGEVVEAAAINSVKGETVVKSRKVLLAQLLSCTQV
jgi:hypothetical protein